MAEPTMTLAPADGGENVDAAVSQLRAYLLSAATLLLGCEPSLTHSLLNAPDTAPKLASFASSQSPVLCLHYVQATATSQAQGQPSGSAQASPQQQSVSTLSVELQVSFSAQGESVIVCKRQSDQALDGARPLAAQLQAVQLAASENQAPFEALHAHVRHSLLPYLRSYLRQAAQQRSFDEGHKGGDADGSGTPGLPAAASGTASSTAAGDSAAFGSAAEGSALSDASMPAGVAAVQQQMTELELALYNCKQDVQIERVYLPIHPQVRAVARHHPERAITVQDLGELQNDAQFLNSLQAGVNSWIRAIQKVSKHERIEQLPAGSDTTQEIKFWLELHEALLHIQEQLQSPEVTCTFNALKRAKRFFATVAFDSDTIGIRAALNTTTEYRPLMKEFPMANLLAAVDVAQLAAGVVEIFGHLKKTKHVHYPTTRYLRLVEAISRDVSTRLRVIVSARRPMQLPYDQFDEFARSVNELFAVWEEQFGNFHIVIRDLAKKRNQQNLPLRYTIETNPLKERISEVQTFRRRHEELLNVITKVLPNAGVSGARPADEVVSAYEPMKNTDVFDVSKQGVEVWMNAVKEYNRRIDRIESQITAQLRDRLGSAKNAKEMFRVFSQFNALFFRRRIRGAIQEYQVQLIECVKSDIATLHDKYKKQYVNSEAFQFSELRDIAPVSGTIIWVKQLKRQLERDLKRVQDILGDRWELDIAGKQLHEDGERFRAKLDPDMIFNSWVADIEARQLSLTGRVLDVKKRGNALQLDIKFDPNIAILFKELRNLSAMGYRAPWSVAMLATTGKRVYPFAVSLREIVRSYTNLEHRISENMRPLIASYKRDVQRLLSQGFALEWQSPSRIETFVQQLSASVSTYHQKTVKLAEVCSAIDKSLAALATCALRREVLVAALERIQEHVDTLNLGQYANLSTWVAELDQRVRCTLLGRVQQLLGAWPAALRAGSAAAALRAQQQERRRARGMEPDEDDDEASSADADADADANKAMSALADLPALAVSPHSLRVRGQVMEVFPPLAQANAILCAELRSWLGIVCDLPRLQSARYDLAATATATTAAGVADLALDATYADLLADVDEQQLVGAYAAIGELVASAQRYVDMWLQYQSLWDMEPSSVYSRLGDDLDRWRQVLEEIKAARHQVDAAEVEKRLGPVVIRYNQVQAKVNNKYDYWHKDILHTFGSRLGESMCDFVQLLSRERASLESQSVDTSSTSDAVSIIIRVQKLTARADQWAEQVSGFRAGNALLRKQRYHFPSDWLELEMVEGEWSVFRSMLARQQEAISSQIPILQTKIASEAKSVEENVRRLAADWARDKPMAGDLRYADALETLSMFATRQQRLKRDSDRVQEAKLALGLSSAGASAGEALQPLGEELAGLQEVWDVLSAVWRRIDEMKETPWNTVDGKKLAPQLELMLDGLKAFPNRVRQYQPFHHLQQVLKGYRETAPMIMELRSPALRDRHWRQLRRQLNATWTFSELTLGVIWDADLQRNAEVFREIIMTAQGEIALETFFKDTAEFWRQAVFDLVAFQKGQCRLIRGWDELFEKVANDANSINAIKISPYFKVFAEEASSWEEKLNRMQNMLDVWVDVQRRWVYLHGIFIGGADIENLLPRETQRFRSINKEFLQLMSRVAKNPLVLDVLAMEGLQRTLDRLADLLQKIQKALSKFLETQREAFPRFYFVGDEDLLEIIGNSKDVVKIQKHMRKMFAGLAHLTLDAEQSTLITGMSSREGEAVAFLSAVDTLAKPAINEWLGLVESEMRRALAALTRQACTQRQALVVDDLPSFLDWVQRYPAQIVLLATQIHFTRCAEQALSTPQGLLPLQQELERGLEQLAAQVMHDLQVTLRRKFEQLITELVHQRDTVRRLLASGVSAPNSFDWLSEMRFYLDASAAEGSADCVRVRMANAEFQYGFEYLGVQDRLVQTPLTDRCYLTLTQALEARLGGSPFGPAGTGKTETVKALGAQLGRFVLVFCCDENFDFQAMGRIFVGLCQVGAYGCFDEFNRLEERMLSAVSQQVQTIQVTLKEQKPTVELLGRQVRLHPDMGIFITMNPGYAGRSNLPDNLKQLFRSIAMIVPDRELIAQVMLFSQGFRHAELLASKIVPLFRLCQEQLSEQSHYDFGLRALKSVLVRAGNMKRALLTGGSDATNANAPAAAATPSGSGSGDDPLDEDGEQRVMIKSVCETMIPKLVAEDIPLLHALLLDVFPLAKVGSIEMSALREQIEKLCVEEHLVPGDAWVEKALQLFQIQTLSHGVMLVGPSGSGKSSAWRTLVRAVERLTRQPADTYVIDPKAVSKDELFGQLDQTTREWTDGLFTHMLRKVIDNLRGESQRSHWVVFDGDVDPEWVENLNSLLDDNKILTLPNGERLAMPDNVRILFEVESLRYATLATVSRCGMVWFSEETVSDSMIYSRYVAELRDRPLDEAERDLHRRYQQEPAAFAHPPNLPGLELQRRCADLLEPQLQPGGLVPTALRLAGEQEHVMAFTRLRVLESFSGMLNRGIARMVERECAQNDLPLDATQLEHFLLRHMAYSLCWGFGGSMNLASRESYSNRLRELLGGDLAAGSEQGDTPLLDFHPALEQDGSWVLWKDEVPVVDVFAHQVGSPDVVIPTVDTVRHVDVLGSWLAERRPLLLCGPPGSGKSMTLTSTLRSLPDTELAVLNFSSTTGTDLILKTFDHHCEYARTPGGVVVRPAQPGRWLVVFCDEINLPAADTYGTQRVISFLRQLTEQGGFWRAADHTWVRLERIQFVGACNPPTDAGRVSLSHRFLRHTPLLFVDFPSGASLCQIYGTYYRALMLQLPSLAGHADAFTEAMVEFYLESQRRFTPDMHPHYIYSPRELSRWLRALYEAVEPREDEVGLDELVRLWTHEGLRLFQDRLVSADEREWTDRALDACVARNFPSAGPQATQRPILFSTWTSKHYVSVDREELRREVQAKLRVFYEEELDVPLVLFNEVLDHILRIDRVLRQPQGHALLIGVSGGGKTVLSRFVAWMNSMSIFTIKVNNRYTAEDFDRDLRLVMQRAGCAREQICFIFDESNVLDSSFLERMNTLLASGDVPGLFEGDDYNNLMHAIKDAVLKAGLMLDSDEELFRWFTQNVRRNLHIVFTMNPASPDFHNRTATSPALFNRCVVDWFGEWSPQALYQVAQEFTRHCDLDSSEYRAPDFFPELPGVQLDSARQGTAVSHRDAVLSTLVYVHRTVDAANRRLLKQGLHNYVTPRHYLDFIRQVAELLREKREQLEEQKLHLNVGLQKLRDTEEEVTNLQATLRVKRDELQQKDQLANEKLKQMMEEQSVAETQRKQALQLQEEMRKQEVVIEAKKERAYADLSKAEPAVEAAKKSVGSIRKSHLDEIKALAKPPAKVKNTLEAVCLMLGKGQLSWADIRRTITDKNFISSVIHFDSETISESVRQQLIAQYLSDPDFTFEAVNRASQACGPLVLWCRAQIEYSEILHRIEPLRAEVSGLEGAAQKLKDQLAECTHRVSTLEERIATYKEEYRLLVSETEVIRAEMTTVESKVERSISLVRNLSSERTRWEAQSETFQQQMSTLVGDVVLSAAFVAYIGFFDHTYRSQLLAKWKARLLDAGIEFTEDLSVVEYLSTPAQRLGWQAADLPPDHLCLENAIILERFNRYPLVIDPSGQATAYLMKRYAERRIVKTSFMDASFLKNLETALRFGYPLLVEDVEHIDPILNPVLNKEVRKAGGRVLITLGDQDVDFSPSFMIFLATRDPTSHFTPDLASRVTFVNFTITPSSLQSQCLHSVLKCEAPDTFQKEKDHLRLQGEFRAQLLALEKELLDALNRSGGNILDDESVIGTLERLKSDAARIEEQMRQTDAVMEEVSAVSNGFRPLAVACSRIYFALKQLSSIHFVYQFSLQFFLDAFFYVLHDNPLLANVQGQQARTRALTESVFSVVYRRVSRSLLNRHRLGFALRLAQLSLQDTPHSLAGDAIEFVLRGGEQLVSAPLSLPAQLSEALSPTQRRLLAELAQLPAFAELPAHMNANAPQWLAMLASPCAERAVPAPFGVSTAAGQSAPPAAAAEENAAAAPASAAGSLTPAQATTTLRALALVKALRPDRLSMACQHVVEAAFGSAFLSQAEEESLLSVVETESSCKAPLMFCSVHGHDAAFKVDDLAVATGRDARQYRAIALGSAEGFHLAEKAVKAAASSGTWVLLKNVHLAPRWLAALETTLHSLQPKPGFRLFLTAEIHPKLPPTLLRQSQVFTFEPAPGIKANLHRILGNFPPSRMDRKPAERPRLYFLLAWLHAVLQERLRYAPLGWTKKFEFGEADLKSAAEMLDYWVDSTAQGRDNLPPEKIPWVALRTLLGQVVYGGRVDNQIDQRLLDSFLQQLFTARSFDVGFSLVEGDLQELRLPDDALSRAHFLRWVATMPDTSTPAWLGLPDDAELVLLENEGRSILSNLLRLQDLDDGDDDDDDSAAALSASQADADIDADTAGTEAAARVPTWMRTIRPQLADWKEKLPKNLKPPTKTSQIALDPMFRSFERELVVASHLSKTIDQDLEQMLSVCDGESKQTNRMRGLLSRISKGQVPQEWNQAYSVPKNLSVSLWFVDLVARLQQLSRFATADFTALNRCFWLGGLFSPEAFITATRQAAARANKWSLESLVLSAELLPEDGDHSEYDPSCFVVTGVRMEGAAPEGVSGIRIGEQIASNLPPIRFSWKPAPQASPEAIADARISVPVYLNQTREQTLFHVDLSTATGSSPALWFQRSVCLQLWFSSL